MKKRIFAALLVAGLSLTMLAGCGGNGDTDATTTTAGGDVATTTTTENLWGDETTTTGDNTTTTTASQTDTTQSQAPVAGNVSALPFDETYTWTLYLTEHAYQPIKENSPKFDYITELTNVVLEVDVGTGTTSKNKLSAAAASGKMYDITCLNNAALRTYNPALFYDLTNVIKTKTPNYYAAVKPFWDDLQLFSCNGKQLGFALVEYTGNGEYLDAPTLPYLRVDILEKNNMKCPTTWEEWFKTMKELKKKYPESTPMSNRSIGYLLEYWTEMLGVQYNLHYQYENKRFACGVLDGRFQKILQFMVDCYEEEILGKNFDQCSENGLQDAATAGQVFFWIDSGSPAAKVNRELQEADPDAAFVGINLMSSHLNNDQKKGRMVRNSGNFQQMYCIGAQAKNVDKLLTFMDWCYTKEGCFTNCYGKLDVTYKMNGDNDPYIPQSVWKKYENQPDMSYALMSDLGLGQICFAPMMDNQNEDSWENHEAYSGTQYNHEWGWDGYDQLKQSYWKPYLSVAPDIDSELLSRYDSIQTYLRLQIVAFIKGNRPMSDFNKFVSELETMGVKEILAACNS